MRKAFLSIFLLLVVSGWMVLWADSATPYPLKMQQPDGSTITLRLHGDEFCSWYTSEDGRTVYRKGPDGWWRPDNGSRPNRVMIAEAKARRQARDAALAPARQEGLGFGEKHFLVILVQWSDQRFRAGADDYFTRALNQSGFSDNGSVGSARDYYMDASQGQFTPVFDVYGPVTLSRKHTDFPSGDGEKHYDMARTMIKEAAALLDAEVDFSAYDLNDDGNVDSIYLLFPGYAQSAGGGEDTIWPHKSSISGSVIHDGVYLKTYACSSELRGKSGTDRSGIGTFCHEFGHVVGLPDLYDTNYEEDGQAIHPSSWNLMASGNHNGDGIIPARMSVYERYILGYIKEVHDLDTPGEKQIPGLDTPTFYRIPTNNEGEFFLPEVRDGKGFDSTLPPGMIIYHVDRSQNVVSGKTATQRWDDWDLINGYSDHPCHYLEIPDDSLRPYGKYTMYNENYKNSFYSLWVFPKNSDWDVSYDVRDYSLRAWDGTDAGKLSGINYADGKASFVFAQGSRSVSGYVTDAQTGEPLKDAVVLIEPASSSASGPARAMTRSLTLSAARAAARASSSGYLEAVTDEYGYYFVSLEDTYSQQLQLSFFASGYYAEHILAEGWALRRDVSLESVIQGGETGVTKTQFPIEKYTSVRFTNVSDYAVAQHYTEEELKDYVGGVINSIGFSTKASGEEVWVFVDYGTTTRTFSRRVQKVNTTVYSDAPANRVDISDAMVTIPAGTDLYVGYLIKSSDADYPAVADLNKDSPEGGFMLSSSFNTSVPPDPSSWADRTSTYGNAVIDMMVDVPKKLDPAATFADLGISYIDLPSGTLSSGQQLPLKLVMSPAAKASVVSWFYDGQLVEGESLVLTAGTHTLTARLKFTSGREEKVESQIVVQ